MRNKREILKRFNQLELELKEKWHKAIKTNFEYYHCGVFDKFGIIELTHRDTNCIVRIVLDEKNYALGRYRVDNRHLWNYLVNYRFKDDVCQICFFDALHDNFVPLDISKETNRYLDDIWLNGEYVKLEQEIFED